MVYCYIIQSLPGKNVGAEKYLFWQRRWLLQSQHFDTLDRWVVKKMLEKVAIILTVAETFSFFSRPEKFVSTYEREKKSGDFNAIFTNRRKTILRLTTQWFKVTKKCPISHFSNTIPIDFSSLVIKASFISLVRSKDLEKIRDFFFVEFTPLCHLFLRLWVTRKIRRPWVRIIRWSIIKTPSIARRRRRQNNREKTVILCENNH